MSESGSNKIRKSGIKVSWQDLKEIPRRYPVALVAFFWIASTFIAGPVGPDLVSEIAHFKVGPIYVGRPISISGDPPHYLLIVNSLIEDFDLDLANNADQVAAGDWDAGTRERGSEVKGHWDVDQYGRKLSKHPPFMPMVLALVSWPIRHTEWVESFCIWMTLFVTLLGIWAFSRIPSIDYRWVLILGFASPLWCYARDVWTEPWIAAAWIFLLAFPHLKVQGWVSFLGTLVKYPFVLVPGTMGLIALLNRDRRRAMILLGSGAAALLTAFLFIQWVFWDVDHFSPFHMASSCQGTAKIFRAKLGIIGLLTDPENGLLPFFPFLIWAVPGLIRKWKTFLPALPFYLLHAAFIGWRAGSGFSARYLIPMIPILVLAAAETKPRGILFRIAVIYSAFFGILGGILPVAVFDRSPWEIIQFLITEIQQVL